MTTALLGYRGVSPLLLTQAGGRPLLLECPPELRVSATPVESLARTGKRGSNQREAEHVWQDDPPPSTGRPRAPEVQIDPRTVFKRHPAPPVPSGPRTRAAEPPINSALEGATFDFLIVPRSATFRVSGQGVTALITYLRTAQVLVAKAEHAAAEGTTIELLPGVFSHRCFTEGAAPSGGPSILQGTLWFSEQAAALPYADPQRKSCFRLELIGARFPEVFEGFAGRLHQILHLRPEVLAVPHDPRRLRAKALSGAADPIPQCDMQER